MDNRNYKRAMAIAYKTDKTKPLVLATGIAAVADKILNEAVVNDIPIYENETIIKLMKQTHNLSHIPYELYGVLGDLLEFIYRMDSKYGKETEFFGANHA